MKRLPRYEPIYAPSPWLWVLAELDRGALALHYSRLMRSNHYAGTGRPIDLTFVPPKEWRINLIAAPSAIETLDALEAEHYILDAMLAPYLRQTPIEVVQ